MTEVYSADKRVKKSRLALQRALLDLLKSSPFEDITITEIVQHADVNRGTFYNNYQDKQQLLEEIMQDVLSDLLKAYRRPYINETKFEVHRIQAGAIEIFRHVADHANFYRVVLGSNSLPGFQYKIYSFLRNIPLQDLIYPYHEDRAGVGASAGGTGDKAAGADYELWCSFYASGLIGMIGYWVENDFAQSHEYMAEQLVALINGQSRLFMLTKMD
ncbi:TetR/AcrR family transcriptional regulator [Paenibacillus pinistramenti]|uniref:TetR/AcrR family transcriptional regulator n=1 Tax=Paenibacillus pinistramenti TaxID=1768003 RepID=UPI001108D1A9|nr:TetR/AcrR family transcriptional regulator [Paenibacillus pinistramenti]